MNTIFIKNMVCDRCIMVVQNELEKLGLDAKNIKLGEVILSKEITSLEKENLSKTLEPLGFEVIDDKKGRIIEKIKNIIIDLVHHQDSDVKTNLSDVLSDKLHHDYNYPVSYTHLDVYKRQALLAILNAIRIQRMKFV